MSLAIIYNGTLVADRCSVMMEPNSLGQKCLVRKLQVSKDKTFAFTNVGPTLSTQQQDILEMIISDAFAKAKGELDVIPLGHAEWIKNMRDFNFFVLTKKSAYTYNRRDPRTVREEKSVIVKDDCANPLVGGTGMFVAAMAVMEGVAMKDVCKFVASVTSTVSVQGDIITQRELKAMKL